MSTTLSPPPTREPYRFTADQRHRLRQAGLLSDRTEEPYRFTRIGYHQMLALGVLAEDDSVELMGGEVLVKMPQGDHHAVAVERLDRRLQRLLPDEYAVRCQCPVALDDDNEPEPDLVVCVPAEQRGGRHPRPEHVLLVIEVADSSLADDRGRKQELYARAGIPVYWVVNLENRRVEVYTDPASHPGAAANYVTASDFTAGQDVPIVIEGVAVGSVPVAAILT